MVLNSKKRDALKTFLAARIGTDFYGGRSVSIGGFQEDVSETSAGHEWGSYLKMDRLTRELWTSLSPIFCNSFAVKKERQQ